VRDTIFISYSSKDQKWLEEFKDALRPGEIRDKYSVWSSRQIPAGKKWDRQIDENLSVAKVALVLVTPDYLASEYVAKNELPQLLDRRSNRGLDLFWVPIEPVKDVDLKLANLYEIEAACPKDRPLSRLAEQDVQQTIGAICEQIIRSVDSDLTDLTRRELKLDVSRALGRDVVVCEEIELGDFSILYKARRNRKDVVVKAAMPSIRLDWVASDFKSRADWFQDFGEPPFIRIIDSVHEDRLSCAIMDYVPFPTLNKMIKHNAGLDPKVVVSVLAQVARAASNLHERTRAENEKVIRLLGPLRPSHIFYNQKEGSIRISPLDISNATLQSCASRPLLTLSEGELSSLSPERYAGAPSQFETDQYYIGLLGLELLTGEPPIAVKSFADLETTNAFFDAPLLKFEKYREDLPELFFVLARMLERRPESRWPDMSEVYRALNRIVEGKLPEKLRNHAIETFKILDGVKFYHDFYNRFFEKSPGSRQLFKDTNWDEQRQKLHEAVGVLLTFRPEDPQNLEMSNYALRHRTLGVISEDFAAFRKAFIDTLIEQRIDGYGIDAWRAILNVGVAYMTAELKA
jgi:hemoglobin-like flavoprotein